MGINEEDVVSSAPKFLDKRLKFLNETVIKFSGPNSDFLDELISYVAVGFKVTPTSPVMYNHDKKQFYIFVTVLPKEV